MQLCNYMQLCNMQLMQLKQLYGTYATLRNFMQLYATLCNFTQLMQLYATMQHALCSFPKNLYATICK
jgi:hypothetical protein